MLRSLKDLEHCKISASDGEVGKAADLLFDDQDWAARYLVAETGGFFSSRRVLISPISFREVDWATHRIHLALTMAKIEHAPSTTSPLFSFHPR